MKTNYDYAYDATNETAESRAYFFLLKVVLVLDFNIQLISKMPKEIIIRYLVAISAHYSI